MIPFFSNLACSVRTNVLYLPIYLWIDSLNNKVAIGWLNSFSKIPKIAHKSYADKVLLNFKFDYILPSQFYISLLVSTGSDITKDF